MSVPTAEVSVVVAAVSVVIGAVEVVEVSVVVSLSVDVPSPHAAKAPIANTKRSFFIVPVFCFEECLVLILPAQKGNPGSTEKS